MAVSDVTQDEFKKEVLEHKGAPVFVDFHAEWCGPCKVTSPIVESLSNQYKNMKFVKVDVDANPDVASQYSVFSIPTFIIFKDGEVASQFVGAMGKEGFEAEIKKVVS